MLDKARQLMELKRQADAIKKELAAEVLEVEQGPVKVTISADMHVRGLSYPDTASAKDIVATINKAIEEAQKVAAKKMQGQMGALQDLFK